MSPHPPLGGKRRANSGGVRRPAIAALLALLLAGGAAAVAVMINRDSAGSSAETSTRDTGSSKSADAPTATQTADGDAAEPDGATEEPTGKPSGDGAPTTVAASCKQQVAAATKVLAEGTTAADHWAAHVKASVDWGAGKISEERKRAIWKETRLAGPDDLKRYEAARSAYDTVKAGCDQAPADDTCAQRADALGSAITAADTTVGDWRWHQTQMGRFADGDFGASHANDLWQAAKARENRNMPKFRSAQDNVEKSPACA